MTDKSVRTLSIVATLQSGKAVLEISDSGSGIPEAVLNHLFEPFFTTKEQGAGLGLGLAIFAGIIRDFGGTLRAENDAGGGARFIIHLRPASPESDA